VLEAYYSHVALSQEYFLNSKSRCKGQTDRDASRVERRSPILGHPGGGQMGDERVGTPASMPEGKLGPNRPVMEPGLNEKGRAT
jgi:hypothetical protein